MAKIARPLPKIALPPIERRKVPTLVANPFVGIQPRRVVFPLFEIEQGPMIPLTQIDHLPLAGLEQALKLAAEDPINFLNSGTVKVPDMPLDPTTVAFTKEDLYERKYDLIDRYTLNPCDEIPLAPARECVLQPPVMPPLVWLDTRPKKRSYRFAIVAAAVVAIATVVALAL
jgi:hypothetical protein